MSEKKSRKSDSHIWAYNAHGSDDPLIKVLERLAARDQPKYVRQDASINRMRLTHDVILVGARKLCTDTGDQEGLRLLDEHEHLVATRAAIREGKPLPSATPTLTTPLTVAPVSTPESQTSAPKQTETTPIPPVTPVVATPTPKPPEQKPKRREVVNLIINESGHSKKIRVE